MGNSVEGGKQAAKTNLEKYGADFYSKIGAMGGKKKVPKGFATLSKEKLIEVSRYGGSQPRRKKS